jgi:transposase InsO family protein
MDAFSRYLLRCEGVQDPDERSVRPKEAASPPAADFMAQQRVFDRFRKLYNEERPHEALEQRPPSSCYELSARELPEKLPERDWDDPQPHQVDKYGFVP